MKSQEICNPVSRKLQPDESVPCFPGDWETSSRQDTMLRSEHLVSSFFPGLLTDSAKSQRWNGAGQKAGGRVLVSGHSLLAVGAGREGHLSRQTAQHTVAPRSQQDLILTWKLGHSPVTTTGRVDAAAILKRKQSFLIVTPLHKAGSPAGGPGKFLHSFGQCRATLTVIDASENKNHFTFSCAYKPLAFPPLWIACFYSSPIYLMNYLFWLLVYDLSAYESHFLEKSFVPNLGPFLLCVWGVIVQKVSLGCCFFLCCLCFLCLKRTSDENYWKTDLFVWTRSVWRGKGYPWQSSWYLQFFKRWGNPMDYSMQLSEELAEVANHRVKNSVSIGAVHHGMRWAVRWAVSKRQLGRGCENPLWTTQATWPYSFSFFLLVTLLNSESREIKSYSASSLCFPKDTLLPSF